MTKQLDAHIFEKEPRGHYVDERWCSERLFDYVTFGKQFNTIYDPACGWGTILHSANAAGYKTFGSDIVNRRRHELGERRFVKRDFLKEQFVVPRDWTIVCNPPFDHVEDFCVKACSLVDSVAMIFLVRRLPAAGKWLSDLPLSMILFMSPRPSMPTGEFIRRVERGEVDRNKRPLKVGGGTQDFCWLVFNKRRTYEKPRAMWLYRDAS